MSERFDPKCPHCGGDTIQELAKVTAMYFIDHIEAGQDGDEPTCEYADSTYGDDGEFAGYECRNCLHASDNLADFIPAPEAGAMSTADGLGTGYTIYHSSGDRGEFGWWVSFDADDAALYGPYVCGEREAIECAHHDAGAGVPRF